MRTRGLIAVLAAGLLVAACGGAGQSPAPTVGGTGTPGGSRAQSPGAASQQAGGELLQGYLNTDALERFTGEGVLTMTTAKEKSDDRHAMSALDKSHYWYKKTNVAATPELVTTWRFFDGNTVSYLGRGTDGKQAWKIYVKGTGTDDYLFSETTFRADRNFWLNPLKDMYNVVSGGLSRNFSAMGKSAGQLKGQTVDLYATSWQEQVATAMVFTTVKVYVAVVGGKPYVVGAERNERTQAQDGSATLTTSSSFSFTEIGTASPTLTPPK